MNDIEIWTPRYHDRVVLIAKYKVGVNNKITFIKDKRLTGEYFLSGEEIKSYPLETNGKIPCYAVSLDALEQPV